MEVQRVFRGLGGPGGLQNAKHHIQQSNTISLKSSYAPILKSFANIFSRKYGIWVIILSRHMKHCVSMRGFCLRPLFTHVLLKCTLRSVNDVIEGITQETPMGASWVIPINGLNFRSI